MGDLKPSAATRMRSGRSLTFFSQCVDRLTTLGWATFLMSPVCATLTLTKPVAPMAPGPPMSLPVAG